jgi:hypothetical protein
MRISIKSFLLILFSLIFCLVSSYLACERDFSGIKIIAPPDTTSHNFTWTIDTISSPFGSGVLRDVAIINENDIWAVGEIYADSIQPWLLYNAVHWDGQQWELKRIPFTGWCSAVEFPPLRTIFAFSINDIWFARGGSLVHYNGSTFYNDCEMNPLLDGSINKIWGADSNDLYAVGDLGTIIHYNGSSWQKIESGTTVDIQDIWGAKNPDSGEWEILAVASSGPFPPQAKQLLSIQGTTVTAMPDSGLALSLAGVWFVPGTIYYVVGDGVFYTEEIGQFWHSGTTHPLLYKVGVRGNAANDVFITGSFGLVSHYNGSTWHHYAGVELPIISGGYGRVSVKSNYVVAVGRIGDQAVILIGRRN